MQKSPEPEKARMQLIKRGATSVRRECAYGKMEEMKEEKNRTKFLTVELLQSSVNGQKRVGVASLRDLPPAPVR